MECSFMSVYGGALNGHTLLGVVSAGGATHNRVAE